MRTSLGESDKTRGRKRGWQGRKEGRRCGVMKGAQAKKDGKERGKEGELDVGKEGVKKKRENYERKGEKIEGSEGRRKDRNCRPMGTKGEVRKNGREVGKRKEGGDGDKMR